MLRFATLFPIALATALTTAVLASGTAFAQDPTEPPMADPMAPPADPNAPPPAMAGEMGAPPAGGTMAGTPSELTRRGVQERAGTIAIKSLIGLNMSSGAVLKPVTVSPDVYFALNDKLQLGIVHTFPMREQTPAFGGTSGFGGPSICLGGTDRGCPRLYNNVGLDVLYSLVDSATGGTTDLSAHVAYFISSLKHPLTDDLLSSVGLGVRGKLHFSDMMALQFDPQIYVGVTNRESNNTQMIYVPVELQYQLNPMLGLALQTGLWGNTEAFGDSYQIPLGLMALYNIDQMIDVGARFSFDNLLGATAKNFGRADLRTLGILVNLRF